MKVPDVDAQTRTAAANGDLPALDRLLATIQPAVFNLAMRMLGHREDAQDATQEILLKVVTHLSTFRGDASFGTWVFQVARNHLLTAVTRAPESPTVSLDAIDAKLQEGLAFGRAQGPLPGDARPLTPEEKVAARRVAIGCTQGMLMTLDRDQRLAYLLDTVFGLDSEQAGDVLGISPAAYRKRLSRARAALAPLFERTCGLTHANAPCRCERQLPALASPQGRPTPTRPRFEVLPVEVEAAAVAFDELARLADVAAVFRAHPAYRAPEQQLAKIREVLGRIPDAR